MENNIAILYFIITQSSQESILLSHNRLILLSKIVSIVFYRYVTGDENTWAFAVCGDIDNSWLEIEDIMAAKHAHNRQITEFKYGGCIRLSVGKF